MKNLEGNSEIYELSTAGLIQTALNDPSSSEAAKFIREAHQAVIAGRPHPSASELAQHDLTPANYLLFLEPSRRIGIQTIPGGIASPWAGNLAVIDQLNQISTSGLGNRSVDIYVANHGTAAEEYETEMEVRTHMFSGSWEKKLAHIRAATICGVSGGTMGALRSNSQWNIESISNIAKSKGLAARMFYIEATIGHPQPGYENKINHYRAYGIHDNRDIRYKVRTFCTDQEEFDLNSPNAVSLDYGQFNDFIETNTLQRGNLAIGIGCVDLRQGFVTPHDQVRESLDLGHIIKQTNTGAERFRRAILGQALTSYSAEEHTEMPIGVVLDPTEPNDETTKLAWYLMTMPAALSRRLPGSVSRHFSETSPMIVSALSAYVLGYSKNMLIEQFRGLFGTLDKANYRTRFGGRATGLYIQDGRGIYDVEHEAGIRMILPENDLGRALSKVEVSLPFISEVATRVDPRTKGLFIHPNPKMRVEVPGARRPLGQTWKTFGR